MLKCFHFPSKSRLHNDPFLPSSLFETGLLSHSIIRGESGDATSPPLNICGKSLEAGRLHHRKYGNFWGNFGNLKEVYLLVHKNTKGIVENLTLFLALLQLIRNVFMVQTVFNKQCTDMYQYFYKQPNYICSLDPSLWQIVGILLVTIWHWSCSEGWYRNFRRNEQGIQSNMRSTRLTSQFFSELPFKIE